MISHKHQCIFIHIPKTGGKSLKKLLFGIPEFGPNSKKWDGQSIPTWLKKPFGHDRAADYSNRPCFEHYFKFSMVRNPWARAVSAFFYMQQGGSNQFDATFTKEFIEPCGNDFSEFIKRNADQLETFLHFKSQHLWISNKQGEILVDHVGRLENWDQEISRIAAELELDVPERLHINKSDHADFRACYSDELWDLVGKVYEKDVKIFGYQD